MIVHISSASKYRIRMDGKERMNLELYSTFLRVVNQSYQNSTSWFAYG